MSSTSINNSTNARRKSTSVLPSSSTMTSTPPTTTTTTTAPSSSTSQLSLSKDATRRKIEQMEAQREQRRKDIQQRKVERKQEEERNLAAGNPGDVDFIGLVRSWRQVHKNDAEPHYGTTTTQSKLCICVRKRPLSEKERTKQDHDSISCYNPHIWVHSAKYKVDGITKYLTHTSFKLDHAFNEQSTTQDVYLYTTLPLVDFVTQGTGGRATVFCYGQTGSGKTFTMNGLQHILCHDLYGQLDDIDATSLTLKNTKITVAFFELYGGFIQDLLHERHRCKLLEDGKGEVNITGLTEFEAPDTETFLALIEAGNNLRTTHTTEANDTSSRSHAICQIFLRDRNSTRKGKQGKLLGKLSMVDLAGSERGTDTKSHNSQRRTESAEINTSLLSLKECIRALGQQKTTSATTKSTTSGGVHVPYRGSKLTLILKDCFTSPQARTTMIATVSPGASATDHSLNTLRYADRIKEQRTSTKPGGRHQRAKAAAAAAAPPVDKDRLDRIMTAIPWMRHNDDDDDVTTSPHAASQSGDSPVVAPLDPQHFTVGPTGLVGPTTVLSPTGLVQRAIPTPENNIGRKNEKPFRDDNDLFFNDSHDHRQDDNNNDDDDDDDDDLFASDNSDAENSPVPRETPILDEEAELRQTVQALFELEESLLNQHMSNIQENAEMLTQEGKLLQMVQNRMGGSKTNENDNSKDADVVDEELDNYAVTLAEFLDRKQLLISKLQSKLVDFKMQLAKEQELAQRVTSLSQY